MAATAPLRTSAVRNVAVDADLADDWVLASEELMDSGPAWPDGLRPVERGAMREPGMRWWLFEDDTAADDESTTPKGWPLRKPVVAIELAAVAARVAGVTAVRELYVVGDTDTSAQTSGPARQSGRRNGLPTQLLFGC